MPVFLLWGIPKLIVLGGGVYWITHLIDPTHGGAAL
jgi:hypothetical protein